MLPNRDVEIPVQGDFELKRIHEDKTRSRSGGRDKARGGSSLAGREVGRERNWSALRAAILQTLDVFPDARDALIQRLRELDAMEDRGTQ